MSSNGRPSIYIAVVLDDRLSHERRGILTRVINTLRRVAQVDVIAGNIGEDEMLSRLENRDRTKEYALVLAPWHRYLAWSRVEAWFGLTRTSGPTFAGFVCDQVHPHELGEQADHLRAIIFDFANPSSVEILRLVRSIITDTSRTGLMPMLDAGTPIFCETWYGGQGLGMRMDQILSLPEITSRGWLERASAVRILLTGLWSLVYEQSQNSSDIVHAINMRTPRAYMQIAADNHVLAIRLCYGMSVWSPKDALTAFWPNGKSPTTPAQILARYADFVRAHVIADTADVEVVVGLFKTAPTDRSHGDVHTLWIEPVSTKLVKEVPFEDPSAPAAQAKVLRPLGAIPTVVPATGHAAPAAPAAHVGEAADRIRALLNLVEERDSRIQELKSGGVGASTTLPPPDAEALLEAFQGRYHDAKYQIRQLELRISDLETVEAPPGEIAELQLQIDALVNREKAWIRKLAKTIRTVEERRATRKKGPA